jgi:hypothetical protein
VATRPSSPTLVGRRAELGQLKAAVDRAIDGMPSMVLVAGEAGVGKTRLVERRRPGTTDLLPKNWLIASLTSAK